MGYVPEMDHRKDNHIDINLQYDVNSSNTTGLEKFRLIHAALPEIDFKEINTEVMVFGKRLSTPLLISSMTGGTSRAAVLNQILAEAAQKHIIALGVGSQRIGIDDPGKMDSFRIRKFAPTALIFSNLGAVQLNYGFGVEECQRAVDSIEADALILHLNPLQEALMDNGDTNFSGLLRKIELIAEGISAPLIVKEVGWGIRSELAKQMFDAGVAAIDIAGAGGTSWSEVEMHRASDPLRKQVASAFKDWGIPTADALISIREHDRKNLIFASGGLKNGVDIVKCVALGANLCGIARPFLQAASKSESALNDYIEVLKAQIKVAMFVVGAEKIVEVDSNKIERIQ
jgi:isopentenyl-diphosphate Delta-isomerase